MSDHPARGFPSESDHWEVLARYVAGESNAREADAVRQWLEEDPRRAELFKALERSMATLAYQPPRNLDVEAALQRVTQRLAELQVLPLRPLEQPRGRWRTIGLRVAAVIALAVAG